MLYYKGKVLKTNNEISLSSISWKRLKHRLNIKKKPHENIIINSQNIVKNIAACVCTYFKQNV